MCFADILPVQSGAVEYLLIRGGMRKMYGNHCHSIPERYCLTPIRVWMQFVLRA